jgi:HDOD domain
MRLGTAVVRSVAFTVAAQQLAKSEELRPVLHEVNQLWVHTIEVASWSYSLAKYSGKVRPDEALFAGMMQDIGKLCIIAKAAKYARLLDNRAVFFDIVQTWQRYAATRVLQAMGVNYDVISHTTEARLYQGSIPPTTMEEIVEVSNLLTTSKNPFSSIDEEVKNFMLQQLKGRFEHGNFEMLLSDMAEERHKAVNLLK